MKKVVFAMLAVGALAALGCEDKKPEAAKPAATTAATTAPAHSAAPAKTAAPGGGW